MSRFLNLKRGSNHTNLYRKFLGQARTTLILWRNWYSLKSNKLWFLLKQHDLYQMVPFLVQNDKSSRTRIRLNQLQGRRGKIYDRSQQIPNTRGNPAQAQNQVHYKKLTIKCCATRLTYNRQSNLIQYSQRQI